MKIEPVKLAFTTTAGGAATVTADTPVFGLIRAVEWNKGTADNGVDATLSFTSGDTAVSKTVLTLSNADSSKWYYPHEIIDDLTGVDLTFDGTRTLQTVPILVNGTLQVVIAQGGNAKTGSMVVYVELVR